MTKMKYIEMPVELKGVNRDDSSLEAIFSTADTDRHGDVVLQNWDLKSFKKNPVILNSHAWHDATEVIGKAEKVGVRDGKLQGKIKFAVAENPKAKVIFDLYAGGFLNAFSVGFMPTETNDKGEISKSELLEVSAVSVPANAMALAKAKGIDVSILEKDADEDEPEEDWEDEPEEAPAVEEEEEAPEEPEEEDEPEEPAEPAEEPEVSEKSVKKMKRAKKKLRYTSLINKAIDSLGEINKVETRRIDVRAEQIRTINRVVRNLIKAKQDL